MKITRKQLRQLVKEAMDVDPLSQIQKLEARVKKLDEECKNGNAGACKEFKVLSEELQILKLNAWIDTIHSNKVPMNYGSITWEAAGTEEDWNQVWEMVDLLYPDQIPSTLKLWDAAHALNGNILNDPELMTQEQARTLHLRDPSYFPVDEDGEPISEPIMPSWSNRTYLYDQKVNFKRQLSPVEV